MKPFSPSRVFFIYGSAIGCAIIWVCIADRFFMNKVPIEAVQIHGWYPLSLGLCAFIGLLSGSISLEKAGIKKPQKSYIKLIVTLLIALYALPFILNLLIGKVTLNPKPNFNTLFVWAGFPGLLFFAFCEEIMWRGVLFYEFNKRLSAAQSTLVIGLLWALWHYPVLIHTRFIYADRALYYVIPAFTLMVIAASFIYSWLRIHSQSIWPGTLLHASMNYLIFVCITPMENPFKSHELFQADIGLFYLLAMFVLAFLTYKKIVQSQNN